MRDVRWRSSLAAVILAAACGPARARVDASRPQGIAVSGIGTVKCRPDLVKIDVRVQSKAEITDDALVKYRDARKRLTEAIEGLKLKNTRLVERNVSISAGGAAQAYQMMMNGMGGGQTDAAQPTEVSASMSIELGGLQELPPEDLLKTVGKVLDTAKDAGGSLGPSQTEMTMAWRYGNMPSSTTVRFVLRDLQKVREQAYEQAVDDARRRATLLARLYDVKLGRVSSVQELHVAGDSPEHAQQYWSGQRGEVHERNEITTDSFAEIPVNVRLMVRFDIAEADEKTAAVAK